MRGRIRGWFRMRRRLQKRRRVESATASCSKTGASSTHGQKIQEDKTHVPSVDTEHLQHLKVTIYIHETYKIPDVALLGHGRGLH